MPRPRYILEDFFPLQQAGNEQQLWCQKAQDCPRAGFVVVVAGGAMLHGNSIFFSVEMNGTTNYFLALAVNKTVKGTTAD